VRSHRARMPAFVATALQTTGRGLLRVNTTESFARVLDASPATETAGREADRFRSRSILSIDRYRAAGIPLKSNVRGASTVGLRTCPRAAAEA
jgi:hypothetical protein